MSEVGWISMTVSIVMVVLLGAITFTCADDRRQIVRAIEAGTPPIEARCAIKGLYNNSGCTALTIINAVKKS